MAFWKPGEAKPEPLSAEVDRGFEGQLLSFNKFDALTIKEQRERLPIYGIRRQILFLVETHATTILVGQTGCGKTTQVPQYLDEAGWAAGGRSIAITQPRRVAAQTIAARVAAEMRCGLGQDVGYAVRFEDVSTPETRIKYITDGVLIREMMEDPLLSKYSVVVVDEAHERSIPTDTLLGLLKKVQRARPDLRLVVSSATLEADLFKRFFDTSRSRTAKAPVVGEVSKTPAVVSVEGRAHAVSDFYLEEPCKDYIQAAVDTVVKIHAEEGPGDVLVFLTGQEEIDTATSLLDEHDTRTRGEGGLQLQPLPLYAGLPTAQQVEAFRGAARGRRKVVVASNVAETSVTIEGVVFVVDSCFVKQRCYDPVTGLESLLVAPASQASCRQRAGRAGRVRPGKCYRLCTERAFHEDLPAETVPEMQRSELSSVVLQLKSLGVDNVMNFEWLAPPPAEAMVRGLELLFALGALDDDARLTHPLGSHMAELPLEPMLARSLLVSGELGCTEEMATVAACLSVQSVWFAPRGQRKAVDEAKLRFGVAEGDHVTFLNVFKGFAESGRSPKWCHKHFINHRAMVRVWDIRDQLRRHLARLGMVQSSCGRDLGKVLRAVTAGFFPHAAQHVGESPTGHPLFRAVRGGQELTVHPSSVLHHVTPSWVVFNSVVRTDQLYMRDVASIQAEWLTELAPHFFQHSSTSRGTGGPG